jgi:hypothetical protein
MPVGAWFGWHPVEVLATDDAAEPVTLAAQGEVAKQFERCPSRRQGSDAEVSVIEPAEGVQDVIAFAVERRS